MDFNLKYCDIVLTVYNNLELTKSCLASINLHTDHRQHLIIVDNGSDQATVDFLSHAKEAYPRISSEILRLNSNQGFPKAVNVGLAKTTAKYICILSNDTIVTKGWIDKMCALMDAHAHIGVVGPSSNNYGLHPKPEQSLDDLARDLEQYADDFIETSCCTGFCMVIRRQILDAVGFFDEIYSPGYFEDTDYCRRVCNAGFLCVLSKGAYVWHRVHSTFSSEERERQFARNRKIFEEKWGVPHRLMCILSSGVKEKKFFIDCCLALAKQGHMMTCVLSMNDHGTKSALAVHANIKIVEARDPLVGLTGWFLFIRKIKKRFTDICYDDNSLKKAYHALALSVSK